jgi:hypothetical protein
MSPVSDDKSFHFLVVQAHKWFPMVKTPLQSHPKKYELPAAQHEQIQDSDGFVWKCCVPKPNG